MKKKIGRPKGEPTRLYSVRHNAALINRVKKRYPRLQKFMQQELNRLDTIHDTDVD